MSVVTPTRDERANQLANLYRAHCKALLRFLGRKVGHHDASDLAHEAFIRIARTDHSQTRLRNERAFLFQIAANLAVDHKRAQSRQSRVLTAVEIDDLLTVADETPSPERLAQSRHELQALESALRELPVRRADAFRLSRIEGLSHASIALRLGVSLRTVRPRSGWPSIIVRTVCNPDGSRIDCSVILMEMHHRRERSSGDRSKRFRRSARDE